MCFMGLVRCASGYFLLSFPSWKHAQYGFKLLQDLKTEQTLLNKNVKLLLIKLEFLHLKSIVTVFPW